MILQGQSLNRLNDRKSPANIIRESVMFTKTGLKTTGIKIL